MWHRPRRLLALFPALLAGSLLLVGPARAASSDELRPSVGCQTLDSAGSPAVWFGYRYGLDAQGQPTPGLSPRSVAVGNDNGFTPGSRDRGQPTLFPPGQTDQAVLVTLPSSGKLNWTLAGLSVSADSQTPLCAPQLSIDPTSVPALLATWDSAAQLRFQHGVLVELLLCQLDEQLPVSCDSATSHQLPALPAGDHRFTVIASNRSASTRASVSWRVLNRPPALQLRGPPEPLAYDAAAVVDITQAGGPPAEQTCQLDGQPAGPCSEQVRYQNLPAGIHQLTVRARNDGGQDQASFSWRVLNRPPALHLAGPSEPLTYDAAAVVDITQAGGPPAEVTCQLDEQPAGPCSNQARYQDLAAGAHQLTVRARNDGGQDQASFGFQVLQRPPALRLAGPNQPLAHGSAAVVDISQAGGPPAEQTCQLDDQPAGSCAEQVRYENLEPGLHQLTVSARNNGGSHRAQLQLEVLPRPPNHIVEFSPPALLTADEPALARWHNSGDTDQQSCQLDDQPAQPCQDQVRYENLQAGEHQLTVRGVNRGGATSHQHRFRVLHRPPTITLTQTPVSPSAWNDELQLGFALGGGPADSVTCQLDDGEPQPCQSPLRQPAPAAGVHRLTVSAANDGGRAHAHHRWLVKPPSSGLSITEHPTNPADATDPASFAFTLTQEWPEAQLQCRLDDGPFEACASPVSYGPQPRGWHTFTVRYAADCGWWHSPKDQGDDDCIDQGNNGLGDDSGLSEQVSYRWRVLDHAPAVQLTATPEQPSPFDAPAAFAWTVRGTPDSVTCQLDDAEPQPCQDSIDYGPLAPGHHRFTVRVQGEGGAGEDSFHWQVLHAAPRVTLTAYPPDPSSSDTPAAFAWTVRGQSDSVTCQLDDAEPQPCEDSIDYGPLAPGSHRFTVRAGGEGGTDQASYRWRVLHAGPQVTLTATPDNPSALLDRAAFAWNTNGQVDDVSCKLDDGDFAPCQDSIDYGPLAPGVHRFTVRVQGEGGSDQDSYRWRVLRAPSQISLTAHPDDPAPADDPASFAFAVQQPWPHGRTECRLDDGDFEACESPLSYGPQSAGQHRFTVRYLAPGSTEAASQDEQEDEEDLPLQVRDSVSYRWRVLHGGPQVILSSTPDNPSASGTPAAFTWNTYGQVDTVSCQLDDGDFEPCAASINYGPLATGTHQFTVRVQGEGGSDEDSYRWRVRHARPQVQLTATPDNPAAPDARAAFTWNTQGQTDSVTCQLDDGAPADCADSLDYGQLDPGLHQFTVRVQGDGGSDQDSFRWRVRRDGPQLQLTAHPDDPAAWDDPARFRFTVQQPWPDGHSECRLDDGDFEDCESPVSFGPLSPGAHQLTVRYLAPGSQAAAGAPQDDQLQVRDSLNFSWQVQRRPAQVNITSAPANPSEADDTPSFTFSVLHPWPGASSQCRLDDGAFASCQSPVSYGVQSRGWHTFTVRYRSSTGALLDERQHRWRVRPAGPQLRLERTPAARSRHDARAQFTWTLAPADPDEQTCQLDDAPAAPCADSLDYGVLRPGEHNFTVRASNEKGVTMQRYSWRVLHAPPAVALTAQPDQRTTATSAQFRWTLSGGTPDTVSCQLDDQRARACSASASFSNLGVGSHRFTVQVANDGGSDERSYSWQVVSPSPPPPESCLDPAITALEPSSARPGDVLAISGRGLGQSGQLRFGAQTGQTSSWSPTRITTRVPDQAAAGNLTVTVSCQNSAGQSSSAQATLTVLPVTDVRVWSQPRKDGRTDLNLESLGGKPVKSVVWRLAGKVIGRGKHIVYAFPPGKHVVDAEVTLEDGTVVHEKLTITVARPPKPQKVRVPSDILFGSGSCTLSAKGRKLIAQVRPNLAGAQKLRVDGYTDSLGSASDNLKLSRCRARRVLKALTHRLRPPVKQKQAVGHGEKNPVASNKTLAGRAANRRVSITYWIVPR